MVDSGTFFPGGCKAGTPAALRGLLCPSPWKVLGLPDRRMPETARRAILGKTWRGVRVPGAICGSDQPLPAGTTFLRHSALWPWEPEVEVDVSGPRFGLGDLRGGGNDVGYFQVTCSNGGGTEGGLYAIADALFEAHTSPNGTEGPPLSFLGIVTSQAPLLPSLSSIDPRIVGDLEIVYRGIERGSARLLVSEYWYGPDDLSNAPSGRATTVWKLSNSTLRPERTVVVLWPVGVRPGTPR